MNKDKVLKLEITVQEAELIFNGLGELKASYSFHLMNKLQAQLASQLEETQKQEELK